MRYKRAAAVLCAALAAAVAPAALPMPLATNAVQKLDDAALAALNSGEASCGFHVRFDRLPSRGSPTAFFRLQADKEGYLTLTIPAAPDDLIGDMEFRSLKPVKRKAWHHVAFNFSRQQRRYAFYLDGELQFENNTQWLPQTGFGTVATVGFDGGTKCFRMYDIALTSDYLRPADRLEADAAAAKADAEAAGKSPIGHLRGWAESLAARADALLAAGEGTTEREIFEVRRDARHAARIAAALAAGKSYKPNGPAVAFTVDPLSQEMFLPYHYPENGELSGRMRIAAARGEYETGSLLVWAFSPLRRLTVRVSDLVCGDKRIPGSAVDVKLVKRVYQTGGAWMTYHRDPRLRILTPNLLVNDDAMFKVDELRCRNYMRLSYPEGTVYADISDPAAPVQVFDRSVPLLDADTLQPVDVPEAGRNQQYVFVFHAPKDATPGIYKGRIDIVVNGAPQPPGVNVAFRILPIDLPDQPSSYDNPDQVFFSNINGFKQPHAISYEDRLASARATLANVRAHNGNHMNGLWTSPSMAREALAAGFIPDHIFEAGTRWYHIRDWRDYFKGTPSRDLTPADKQEGMRRARRAFKGRTDFLKSIAPDGIPMSIFLSESGSYYRLADVQREQADVAHELGHKVFAHGGNANREFALDVQDMNSDAGNPSRERAENWHAVGGAVISYCFPFPSSENPQMFRRWNGFERYKKFRYDGNMLHGFVTRMYDEFRDDPGGDGNYRNFCVAYPRRNGHIYTLAWEGWREAYDDLRYATKLKQLCVPLRDSPDIPLRTEARRQLAWLDRQDGSYTDLNALRRGLIDRILTIQTRIAAVKEAR